ncbi:carbon starvation CstA family protein [Paraliomyxa miuraensis]|uniref:carbon starvation CstA family protein n=1 Tax=Paraliomyxa miuraensis TaxID=376150 RepID=UPI00389AD485
MPPPRSSPWWWSPSRSPPSTPPTRLLRFNIEEIGASLRIPLVSRWSGNRYVASAAACGVIALFAFYEVDVIGPDGAVVSRPAGLALWQLFGTTNQLLAALTLVMVTLYLRSRGWPSWPAAIPAVGMIGSTLAAMIINLTELRDPLLLGVGSVLLLLGTGVLLESALSWVRAPKPKAQSQAQPQSQAQASPEPGAGSSPEPPSQE